ncbi:integrase, catalytic region, zinc finger, CCHC-type containing protein [Tanacetum coccineum]
MLNIFKSMEQKVDGKSSKENILQKEIDQLLEVSLTSEIQNCVLISVAKQKNEMLNAEHGKSSSDSKDIQANLLKRIKILENDFKRSQAQKRENIKLEYKKLFNSIKATRTQHQKELDELIELVNQKTYAYADVRAQNQDHLITISELKNKLKTVDKGKNVNTKFDKSETSGTLLCVTSLPKNIAIKAKKGSNSKVNPDRSRPVTSHPTLKNEQGVERSNSVRRPKSRDTTSKNRVLKNTNAMNSTAHVQKMPCSASIDSNKCKTMNSTICHADKGVLNTKNVTAVNDGSNIVCVSCGKDVFLFSYEKCVARYALTRNSSVKRALFTTPIATKSKNLGATSIVAKSRLSVAKTPTETKKVSSVIPLSPDSSQSRTLSNYMKNKIATSKKWQKWYEYQQSFNWTPKSNTAQSLPRETKSRIRVRSTSNTSVSTQKWRMLEAYDWQSSTAKKYIEKFMGTVYFGSDYFAAITGYGDYVQGNLTICHVYFVEGLRHNLLSGDDLLTGSRDSNGYAISIFEMAASSPVCLMSRATSTKSWLWHRKLSHLNFGTINQLTSKDLVDRLSKFKYNKDHLCSACEQGKSKIASLSPKLVPSTESKLKLPHIDLCRPMMVANIVHKTSIACTPQQNGVVEQQNQTLVEAARTKLIFSKSPKFLWAEAIATACITQNRSIVHTRYNKAPYELIRGRKPNIQYFHVFGSLCYPTNNRDDLRKMKSKAYIGIFIGYSESSRGFRIYNR